MGAMRCCKAVRSSIRSFPPRGRRQAILRRVMATSVTLALTGDVIANSDIPSNWLGGSGDWTSTSQWSTAPLYPNNGTPSGSNYVASILTPGANVNLGSTVTVDGIILNSPGGSLTDSGNLAVNGTIDLQSGAFTLNQGQIANARIQSEGGSMVIAQGGYAPTLTDVQLAVPVTVPVSGVLQISDNLNLASGSITLTSNFSGGSYYGSSVIGTGNSMSITGTGSITFSQGPYSSVGMGYSGQFTIGPGVTINSGSNGGTLSAGGGNYNGGTLINQGTINVTSDLNITSNNIINQGTINLPGGYVSLNGSITTANLGNINSSGGTLSLTGSLNNSNSVLDLSHIGRLSLSTGTIDGGTIVSSGPATISLSGSSAITNASIGVSVAIGSATSTLANVTLTNSGTVSLTAGSGLNIGTISGTGQIILNGIPNSSGYNSPITGNLAAGLTLETGTYVPSYGGYASFQGSNFGTILSRTSGQIIQLGGNWSNPSGMIQASGGGVISITSFPGAFGNLAINAGTLDVEVPLNTSQLLGISASAATYSFGQSGSLNNSGSTFNLTGNETLQLGGGSVNGGVVSGTPTDQVAVSGFGHLNGLTTSVPITIQAGAALFTTGLSLNATSVKMIGGSNYIGFYYSTSLSGPISGTGSIFFENNSQNQLVSPVTIAPGIAIKTDTGSGYLSNTSNQGTIVAGTNHQEVTLLGSLTNTGLIEAEYGGTIVTTGIASWTDNGILALFDGGTILANKFTFGTGAALDVGCDPGNSPGLLAVTGNLDLTALPPIQNTFAPNVSGTYLIATYTGTLSGRFTVGDPNMTVDYSQPGKIFVSVPEPTGVGMLVCLGVASLRRRRTNPQPRRRTVFLGLD